MSIEISDMSDTDDYDLSNESDNLSQHNGLSPNRYLAYLNHPHGNNIDLFGLPRNQSPTMEIYRALIDDSSVSDIFPDVDYDSTYGVVSFHNLSLIYFILILFHNFRVKH